MNRLAVPVLTARLTPLALIACMGISVTQAEDVVSAKVQSDAQISVWVDDASLELFVSQLASITGRQASVESNLDGQVSGRFNGSMADTLGAMSKQFPVLFDMDETSLGVVSEASRKSVTVALGSTVIDEQLQQQWLEDVLPGNDIELREGEVVVSGHPAFVQRLAQTVVSAAGSSEQPSALDNSLSDIANGATSPVPVVASKAVTQVVDSAALEVLDQMVSDDGAEASGTASSSSGRILWVTDIPGFETF